MEFNENVELAFSDTGAGGKTVVLLHGHPFNHSMWNSQIAALQSEFRVVAPDLRGYGESPLSGEVSRMKQMAEDVRRMLDFLGLDKIVLGGLSMGGYVALEFYNLFPERVSAIVLADTKAAADTEQARQKRFETAEMLMREGIEPLVEEMLPKVFAAATLENSPETVAKAREMMRATNPAGAAAGLRGMAERNDHSTLLTKINVPALIIVGDKDSLTPPEEAEKMQRAIENSRLVKIPDAGHLSPMEKPEEVNQVLLEFLRN